MSKKIFISRSFGQTAKIGERMGKKLKGGEVLALFGDLGGGKTTFVKGLAKGLGIKRRVVSPTFIIERVYKADTGLSFYHMDLYRLDAIDEDIKMELTEISADNKNVIAIEWADKAGNVLPQRKWSIHFEYMGENERKITIENE